MIKYKHWTLKKMFAVCNIQYDTIYNCMLARVSSVLEKIVPKKHCLCSYNSLSKEDNFQCYRCIPANMQYLYKTCITFLNWLILNMNTDLTLNWATDSACGARVFRVHRIVPSFFSKAADWSGLSKCWEMLKKTPP